VMRIWPSPGSRRLTRLAESWELTVSKTRKPTVRPPPADGARPKNRLLTALPADAYERLRPHLETVAIPLKLTLHKAGERIEHVYFPNGGVCSVTTLMPDGTMVEAATVGDEGMLCIEPFFGEDAVAPGQTMVQVPDTSAEKLGVEAFRLELARRGSLHVLIGHYAQVVIAQMMQSTACNALHQVQQRCARWLLMTHDRTHQQDFHLSHEFLAVMLGVQRPTVTVVAGTLQQAGLISYKHGRVKVLDRAGLEAASCDCYAIIRGHFDRLTVKSLRSAASGTRQ
jgi:CRP-like cAMP-binding protein